MSFDLSGFANSPFVSLPAGMWGYGLVGAYALATLVALGWTLGDWRALRPRHWLGVVLLAGLGAALAQLFILRFPADILPPPGLPAEPQRPGLAFFALAPAFLAAGWLGAGPAIVVGLATGFSRAAWETYSLVTPFEYALIAALVAAALRQNYRGWFPAALRHPVVVGALVGGLLWPSLYLSYFAYTEAAGLAALDYVNSLVFAAAPVFFGQAVLAGLLAELARLGLPDWWVKRRSLVPPPYLRSLNRRLQIILIPLFVGGIILQLWAVVTVAMRTSTTLAVRQMERAAEAAGRDIPFFVQSGYSLLLEIANSQDWFAADSLTQTANLLQSMRALPFFKQLTLLDRSLQPAAVAGTLLRSEEAGQLTEGLRPLVERALQGIPQTEVEFVPATAAEPMQVEVVFVTPVLDPATRQVVGALLGRADLASNPLLQSTFSNLSSVAAGVGRGFLVDERGQVIYDPDATRLQQPFVESELAEPLPTSLAGARAYRDRETDGTRRLLLVYDSPGHPWTVVIVVPNQLVLGLTADIAGPIIGILLLIGGLGLALVSIIANRVTRPAVALASAAQRISENQLEQPVSVAGEDEIGQAGQAFERMRQRLRARLAELNLLLKVSQGVASHLNLAEALPPILEGAQAATDAAGARLVLSPVEGGLPEAGAPGASFAVGPAADLMSPLDIGVLELTRAEGRVVIENVARARAVLDVAPVAGKLHALIALPLRQESIYYGALWLGFDRPHTFAENEVNFLATLAGQAAVAVANARLFDAAEQGRQRLAAILASTPDSVVVTDRSHRLLLINPAAEAAFELTGRPVVGRPVAEVLPNRDLARLIQDSRPGPAPASGEFQSPAGRTLYASVSPIISADGATLGRVCILRDVTHFKELDMMKSEFVATVSHDLRAPLTFMRGYATMLPMVGALTDKQREFADKIVIGIEQMTKLIDDLLDLGRVEAGVGLAKEPCQLDEIVHSLVDTLGPVAANKGLTLQTDVPRDLPLLSGDPILLRQAISNLVDNAIKYTPTGGQVRIQLTAENGLFRVAVSDTGVGIALADQAHLFEKFFRVKQRGSTQVKGSGLGLAIVKSIVERHGGRVWMESKLGQGSTFYMEVPREAVSPTGRA